MLFNEVCDESGNVGEETEQIVLPNCVQLWKDMNQSTSQTVIK
jgi:hypothetical protein